MYKYQSANSAICYDFPIDKSLQRDYKGETGHDVVFNFLG